MPTQYEHTNESKDCPICGIEFAHTHLDIEKPKDFIYRGLEMKRVVEGELSPDGKASVVLLNEKHMPNTEWWREFVTHIDYTDEEPFGVLSERIPSLLAHHRKMIVKEIRDEIEKEEQKQPRTGTEAMFQDTYNEAITRVLSLHCLKENE